MASEPVTINLGAEYDEVLAAALRAVLAEVGAEEVDSSWGVGGSQEISRFELMIAGERVVIEAETYIGLSVTGDRRIVEDLANKVRARLAAGPKP